MPSLWSSFSFSSGGGGDRPLKGKNKSKSKSSSDIFTKGYGRRKLTRQHHLAHSTDDHRGGGAGAINSDDGVTQSLPVSPDCGPGTSSGAPTPQQAPSLPCRWSKQAVPQPLPLPEVSTHPKHCDGQRVGAGPLTPAETRDSFFQNFAKATDDIIRKTKPSPVNRRRGFQQDLNVYAPENEFFQRSLAKSAPSSSCSSPVVNSQRYSTIDISHPSFRVSPGLEPCTTDRLCRSHQVTPSYTPEHSPRHSPTLRSPRKYGNSRSSPFILPSHVKSLPDSSPVRSDTSNPNVHPLPLPLPKPLTTGRQSNDKSQIPSVKGQWQRGKCIGRGTYGSVYIATHRETGATCAMKEVEMIPDDPKSAECIQQLEQEIKLLRELKHPNIVQYYGCEKMEDRFCIYLEYVHPGSISKYVQEHCGAMTESIVRNFTRHILSGLAYLHSKRTIHRDIKGANLLVDASGVVKLADFGLAKHLVGHEIALSLKGTPHWMAPEVLQAALRKDSNPELAFGVDIWSVGCTAIEMLTGKPPWSECSPAQAMFSVLNKMPPIPETLSAEGKDFLHWCFQRRPEDRPCALKLLDHPFLRSSQDQNTACLIQEFSGVKLNDLENSSNWSRRNKDVMPHPSSTTRSQQGKLPLLNGETSRQLLVPESSNSGGSTPHHSPCRREILPHTSSPEFQRSANSTSPSNLPSNLLRSAVSNNIVYSFSSCKGNLNLVMPKMAERKKEGCNVQQEIN